VIPSSNLVGAIEAKTKFGELLERVQLGDSFTITKHGRAEEPPFSVPASWSGSSRVT